MYIKSYLHLVEDDYHKHKESKQFCLIFLLEKRGKYTFLLSCLYLCASQLKFFQPNEFAGSGSQMDRKFEGVGCHFDGVMKIKQKFKCAHVG